VSDYHANAHRVMFCGKRTTKKRMSADAFGCDYGDSIEFDELVLPRGLADTEDGPVLVSLLMCRNLYQAGYGCRIVEQRIGMGGYLREHFRKPHDGQRWMVPEPANTAFDTTWRLIYKKWHQSLDEAYDAAAKWAGRKIKQRGEDYMVRKPYPF
jgi:hypothetical protein